MLTFLHNACVQWNRHPCRETSGSNCARTVHRARSKSNVILGTAGGEGSMLSTSCSTAR